MEYADKAFARRLGVTNALTLSPLFVLIVSGFVQGLNPRSDKYRRKLARLSGQVSQVSKIWLDLHADIGALTPNVD